MTIDDYIEQRNRIYLIAENRYGAKSKQADDTWERLGVANRHIERVLRGQLTLPMVEKEIATCLIRAAQDLET